MGKKRKPVLNGDRHELGEYIRDLADLMGLRDWYISMKQGDPEDQIHGAECDVRYGQKCAEIAFRSDWVEWDADEVRWLAVHELLHCHMEPMRWAVNNTKFTVGDSAFNVIGNSFLDAMELALDGIAREWSKTLPLPIKAKEKKA